MRTSRTYFCVQVKSISVSFQQNHQSKHEVTCVDQKLSNSVKQIEAEIHRAMENSNSYRKLLCSSVKRDQSLVLVFAFIDLTRVLTSVTDRTFLRVNASSIISFCFYPITCCIVFY
jgi:hypothetical protein